MGQYIGSVLAGRSVRRVAHLALKTPDTVNGLNPGVSFQKFVECACLGEGTM